MNSEEIFSNSTYLTISLLSLLLLGFAALYSSSGKGLGNPLLSCFKGVLCCFASNWLIADHAFLDLSFDVIVFVELMILLIGLCFFVSAATQLLVDIKAPIGVLSLVFICGFVLIVMFLFISPDGAMINKIRSLLPLVGFCYLAVSFWSKASTYGLSYFFAAGISSYVTFLYVLSLIGGDISEWWTPLLVNVLFSVSFLMSSSVEISKTVDSLRQELFKNNQKFRDVIENSPFPIVISRLSDDKILIANDNAVNLLGIFEKDLERYKLKDFFADPMARKVLNEKLEKDHNIKDFEFLSDTQNAFSPFWLLSSASVIEYDMIPALYMAFQDITLRKNKENLLKDQATKDPLTGIFNRRYFEEEVSKIMNDYDHNIQKGVILMLDADHFKNVNDTYGHKTGDAVLIELASMSNKALRDSDIVARYGGEEFVMFLAETNLEQALAAANRLRESISKIVVKADDGRDVMFTVSIGLTVSDGASDLTALIKQADLALYKAKENGRNRVEVYNHQSDLDLVKVEKTESHHPIYDIEPEEEVSLIRETTVENFDERVEPYVSSVASEAHGVDTVITEDAVEEEYEYYYEEEPVGEGLLAEEDYTYVEEPVEEIKKDDMPL